MFWHSERDIGLRHEALFYASPDELLAGAVPFVEDGLALGEAVLVVLPPGSRRPLEAALDGERGGLRFAPMEELGRNPGRIIPVWRELVDAGLRDGIGVRGIGEPIWAGRGQAELEECERHEALLNLAFADAPRWSLMCPYNTAELGDRVLDLAARNHPYLREGGEVACSGPYGDAAEGLAASVFGGALEPPSEPPLGLCFGAAELPLARRLVAARGADTTLPPRRVDDMVLAANEVATNSIRHGGGEGTLRVWRDDGALVCEVSDRGHFHDPLAGRVRPVGGQIGGRGLWIANQVCDLVQIRSAADGSVVRLRVSA